MGVGAVDVAGTVRPYGRGRRANGASVGQPDGQTAGRVALGRARAAPGEDDQPAHPIGAAETSEIDAAVVRAAARGDHKAFARIVTQYEPRVRALAFHLLGDTERTHDVVQDAFLDAYRGLPSFRGDAAFGTWLHRVTYNAALRRLRRPVVAEVPIVDHETGREDAAAGGDDELELHDALRTALAALPPEQRLTLLLIDRDGYDYREVAGITDVAPGTVCSRLHRARAAVKDALRAGGLVISRPTKET
jgi:RNA polymerase sigma-70 factor, ECF subfamily